VPSPSDSFIGRDEELDWLQRELVPASTPGRVVSLVGVGGVGKTRLALEAASRIRSLYPDGVWLVELSLLPPAAGMVAIAIQVAVRLVGRTPEPPIEVLSDWAHGRRAMLILDSCEHMLPDCVSLVPDLLATAPGLHFLVTSRERLGLPRERTLQVGSMRVDDDAVRLFAERALAADSSFVLDEANRRRVASMCDRLDRLPLAIELAAARLNAHSLDELDRHLGQHQPSRLDLLTAGNEHTSESLDRHFSMRATIGWSHELCQPLERLLWARLSIFPDGFSVEAAQEVCAYGPIAADSVPALLGRLVEQSVVLPHPSVPARFHLLNALREYGADWLRELGEEDDARLRHGDYYLRLAHRASAEFNTDRQEAWCDVLRLEAANMSAAVDWSLEEPSPDSAPESACIAGVLWIYSGSPREHSQRIMSAALRTSDRAPGNPEALWLSGVMPVSSNDWDADGAWRRQCAEVAKGTDDHVAIQTIATHIQGCNLVLTGRSGEAVALLSGAERFPLRDDWVGTLQLQIRLCLSFAHLKRGDHIAASAVADEVCQESRRCGEHLVGAAAESILAQVNLALGAIGAAMRNATAAVQRHARLHNACDLAMDLNGLAAVIAASGDGYRAARVIGIAKRVWDLTLSFGDSPLITATRADCERQIRDVLGDRVYETAYQEGLTMSCEEALEYLEQVPQKTASTDANQTSWTG